MRRGGLTSGCLLFALLAFAHAAPAYGHHFGHTTYWAGGYIVSGYPNYYPGWGPYGATPVVGGMTVFGPQAGVNFGSGRPAAGPVAPGGGMPAAGPVGGGQAVNAPAPAAVGGGQGAGVAAPGDLQPHGKPRTTNTESKARAGKFIQYGDALFVKQKYNSALERYREAATVAPDLAEAYFRQAFALVGSSQYDSAKKALDRGLRMRPNWPDTNFELATLYGPKGKLARTSHRESLASAIEQNPQSADLLLMMGVLLYCDGERDRSRLFFDRAIELGANQDHLFDRFIAPRPGEPEPAAQAARRADL